MSDTERRAVLRRFHCPFRSESTICYHEAHPERCLFAHPATGQPPVANLPNYACIYELSGRCRQKATRYCPNGIHLSPLDLSNVAQYEADNVVLISEYYRGDENRECSICYERVVEKHQRLLRRFAILEKCSHCFCSACMTQWRRQSTLCPICQVDSVRMVVTRHFLMDGPKKDRLFSLRA